MSGPRTCLLLRTHRFDAREKAFLDRLGRESGFPVAVAVDETGGPIECGALPKVSVTPWAARRLGLYCPRDFAWRCGDYALYLARHAMPDIELFWQIEPDVRAAYRDYGDLFRIFTPFPEIDLIGFDIELSKVDHWWHPTMLQRTSRVYRSLFGLTRFSARALDVCEYERRRDFWNPWARLMWPNDETFTATTLFAAGMNVRDANAFGQVLYTRETFSFSRVTRGETFEATAQEGLVYHPVLWGDNYDRKVAAISRPPSQPSLLIRRKLLRLVVVDGYDSRVHLLCRMLAKRRPIGSPK